jgi:hypothetical protein
MRGEMHRPLKDVVFFDFSLNRSEISLCIRSESAFEAKVHSKRKCIRSESAFEAKACNIATG